MSSPKKYLCRNGCGQELTFDNSKKSATGKLIPLNASDKQPHQCPRSQQHQSQQASSPPATPSSDKPCNSPERLDSINLVQFEMVLTELARKHIEMINSKLKSFQLALSVEDRKP